jgi:transcriptional regulator with XRE-family HTH domain
MAATESNGIPEWTIGDRLGKTRRAAGVSSSEMCEYLGIHRNSLNAYERDRSRAPLAILRLWAIKTGYPLEWLQHGELAESAEGALRSRCFRESQELAVAS